MNFDDDVETARDLAATSAAHMTKCIDQPVWFESAGGDFQILICEDDYYAYAWVGRRNKGVLVAFGTSEFETWSLREPVTKLATAVALAFYLDLTVSLAGSPEGTRSYKATAGGGSRNPARYVPTPSFLRQADDVAIGNRNPPMPHMVATHIRRLEGYPNRDHVAEAPPELRALLGLHDTWVRSHVRGDRSPKTSSCGCRDTQHWRTSSARTGGAACRREPIQPSAASS